ncbi:hypothetical protein ACRTEV_04950 [Rossellomorea arthrocnemi]
MNNKSIHYIQEGLHVSKKIKEKFQLEGRDLTGNDSSKCNFTGLVVKGQNILISWPKKFHTPGNLEPDSNEDIKLLFDILVKYLDLTEECAMNEDDKNLFQDSYPLKSFQNILQYYRKYGLYREENNIETKGYSGKIDWKKTMAKSNKVISKGKLLYLPFIIKDKFSENVFISECMAYVINETTELLSFILPKREYIDLEYNKDVFLNRDFVLSKLQSFKGKIFKDINKKLLHDLITFFEQLGNPSEFKYKNYYFSSIWEDMIGEYLNRNLFYIDTDKHEIKKNCKIFNFGKRRFGVGNREIEVDHYFETDTHIYILDSKYYQSVQELNYKQIAYDYFLRNEEKVVINALIVPNHIAEIKNHFAYVKDNLFISEHYLVVRDIMRDCARK